MTCKLLSPDILCHVNIDIRPQSLANVIRLIIAGRLKHCATVQAKQLEHIYENTFLGGFERKRTFRKLTPRTQHYFLPECLSQQQWEKGETRREKAVQIHDVI